MRATDLIELVIQPTLMGIKMYSQAAEQLIAGTIAQESLCGMYLKQQSGPALGIAMIEPSTHADIHHTYLRFRSDLMSMVYATCGMPWHNIGVIPYDEELIYNLRYAVAIARIKYARVSEKLPAFGDVADQALYWKAYYNSALGKGKPSDYMTNYEKFIKPYYNKIKD